MFAWCLIGSRYFSSELCMDISRIDLNLLVYLDVLLRERNVTKAANHLGITQPAMSNSLRRLRDLFADPLLVRTSEGMTATERARELQPLVRSILSDIEQAVQEKTPFAALESQRVFAADPPGGATRYA